MKPITCIAFYHYLKYILSKFYDRLFDTRMMNNTSSLQQHDDHQLRLFAQCIQNWKRKYGEIINLYTFRAPLSLPMHYRQQYASNHPQHQHKSNNDDNDSDNDYLSNHCPQHQQQQHDNDNDNDDNRDGDLNFPSFDEFILFSLQSVWIQAQRSSNLEATHTLCVLIIESLQLISEFIQKVNKNND
jgi:hypothetical protein